MGYTPSISILLITNISQKNKENCVFLDFGDWINSIFNHCKVHILLKSKIYKLFFSAKSESEKRTYARRAPEHNHVMTISEGWSKNQLVNQSASPSHSASSSPQQSGCT